MSSFLFEESENLRVCWLNKKTPSELIQAIKPDIGISEGRLTIRISGNTDFLIHALYEKIDHPFLLDDELLFAIFQDTVLKHFAKHGVSKEKEALTIFEKKCKEIDRNLAKYTLITSISLNQQYLPRRRYIESCVVSFYDKLPKKYERKRQEKLLTNSTLKEQDNYIFACVSVDASSENAALEKAVRVLDIIRSIWHIGISKKIQILQPQKDKKYSTNSIFTIGQVYTLHPKENNKKRIRLWYEDGYKDRSAIKINNFSLTEVLLDKWLAKIKKSPYKDRLINSLVNYIRALDCDPELRFMRLWAVLEKLLNTDQSELLIKRIIFFYEDRLTQKVMLESLRYARNRSVHVGSQPFNIELKNFQLCEYIEHIIKFFIKNPFNLRGYAEMINLISSSTDSRRIDEQIKTLHIVKKFIKDDD